MKHCWAALLAVCACATQPMSPSAGDVTESARWEEQARRLDQELRSLALAAHVDCKQVCSLAAAICDLADRICLAAARHPEAAELPASCRDAKERCQSGRQRVDRVCRCS